MAYECIALQYNVMLNGVKHLIELLCNPTKRDEILHFVQDDADIVENR